MKAAIWSVAAGPLQLVDGAAMPRADQMAILAHRTYQNGLRGAPDRSEGIWMAARRRRLPGLAVRSTASPNQAATLAHIKKCNAGRAETADTL